MRRPAWQPLLLPHGPAQLQLLTGKSERPPAKLCIDPIHHRHHPCPARIRKLCKQITQLQPLRPDLRENHTSLLVESCQSGARNHGAVCRGGDHHPTCSGCTKRVMRSVAWTSSLVTQLDRLCQAAAIVFRYRIAREPHRGQRK